MSREQQMVIVSTLFGVGVALTAMYARGALPAFTMIGGLIVGLGWAFYPQRDEKST